MKQLNKKQRSFFFCLFLSPLLYLFISFRDSIHIFIGLEILIFLVIGQTINKLQKNRWGRVLGFSVILAIIYMNIAGLYVLKQTSHYVHGVIQDTSLNDQIQLINKMYGTSKGENFSYSSLTTPFGYNTTWAYLIDYYGIKQFGYKPAFFGPDQNGIFGNHLSLYTSKPLEYHFIIKEPDLMINDDVLGDFLYVQGRFGEIVHIDTFGTLVLYQVSQE